jgi:hypothetical protein
MADVRMLKIHTTAELEEVIAPRGETLSALQAGVGGYIECVDCGALDMWIHDEGLVSPWVRPNFPATFLLHASNARHARAGTIIYGDVMLANSNGEGETTSISDTVIGRLYQMFRQDRPE